jgi:hypothetical protein
MLFAYIDDGRLEVLEDIAAARREYASDDIESGTIRLFDDAGNPLTAVFQARSARKFLGMVISDDRGPFDLVPSAQPDAEKLVDAFAPSVVLMPNRWFKDVDAVRAHLATAASDH